MEDIRDCWKSDIICERVDVMNFIRKVLVSIITFLLVVFCRYRVVYGAGSMVLENAGYCGTEQYGTIGGLESSYNGIGGFYDCYIPYEETIGDIGGYDSSVEDSVVQSKVGSIVGYFSADVNIDGLYLSRNTEWGSSVYSDKFGNDYFVIDVPMFLYNYSGDTWEYGSGGDVSGDLVDAVLTDGTIIHMVVRSTMYLGRLNGGRGDSSIESFGSQCEVSETMYFYLFDSTGGYVFDVSGKEGSASGFERHFKLGNGVSLAYMRVYDGGIGDVDCARENTGVYEKVDVTKDLKYPEDTLGMDNDELVASKFSDETQKIVEEHCMDFDASNFDSFMASHGGFEAYMKSLGGVFEKYVGEDIRIPIRTAGDLQEACEYVYGIICIYGFDYSNGNIHSYGRWRSGNGVNESAVTKDAFYPKNYPIPDEYKKKYATPRIIERIASQENMKQKGVNTCCNFCVDLVRRKTKLENVLTTSNGGQPGTCDTKNQMKLTYQLIGKYCITDITELQVGDVVHCFTHKLTTAETTTPNKPNGWKHVLFVGEIHEDTNEIVMYNTGHDLTNDGNYKQVFKRESGVSPVGYAGWLGTRWFTIDQSVSVSNHNSSGGMIGEDDVQGLDVFNMNKDAQNVSFPTSADLDTDEKLTVSGVSGDISARLESERIDFIRALIAFVGLCLYLYVIILIACYCFDRANIVFDINMLSIVTLGRLGRGGELPPVGRFVMVCGVVFLVGSIILSGAVYSWAWWLVLRIGSLF